MNVLRKVMRGMSAVAACAGLLAMVGGCESSQQRSVEMIEVASGRAVGTAAERPAPRAEAPAAEAAEAPRAVARGSAYRPVVPAGYDAVALAFPTGEESTSAILLHQVSPIQVRANAPYNYELHVTNLTGGTLQNVVVKNESLSNLRIQSSTPAGTTAGDSMLWNLGTLAPRETKVIKLVGVAGAVGTAANCLSVTYANTLCANVAVVQPALAITKSITPESILNCTPIVAVVEVKNTGTGEATNVVVTDTPDAGLTAVSGGLTFNVGTLKAGESRRIEIPMQAARTGTFNNVASVAADGGLTATSQRVATKVTQPVLAITCKSPERVFLGRPVTYEFTVRNTGDAACDATTITANLPAGATNVVVNEGGTVAGSGASWNIGALAPGASKTVTVTFRPAAGAGTAVQASASAACKCAAAVTTQCQTNVFGLPDIGTAVTDDDGVVEVGANHTYRVEVQNQGQVPLTNVRMVVTLPAGLEFVSADRGTFAGGKVTFDFGTVAPGSGKQLRSFIVRSTRSGELLVIGETTCTEIKTPIRDDELTVFVDR